MKLYGPPKSTGAQREKPRTNERADRPVAPAIFEQGFLSGAIAQQRRVPIHGRAALRAAGVGETIEVIVALAAGELFERRGVGPLKFQPAGRTDGLDLAAKVVPAPRTLNVEMNQVPGRRG